MENSRAIFVKGISLTNRALSQRDVDEMLMIFLNAVQRFGNVVDVQQVLGSQNECLWRCVYNNNKIAFNVAHSAPVVKQGNFQFYVTLPNDPTYYSSTAVIDGLSGNVTYGWLNQTCSSYGFVLECQIVRGSGPQNSGLHAEVLFASSEMAADFVRRYSRAAGPGIQVRLKQPTHVPNRGGNRNRNSVKQQRNYANENRFVNEDRATTVYPGTAASYSKGRRNNSGFHRDQLSEQPKQSGRPNVGQPRPRSIAMDLSAGKQYPQPRDAAPNAHLAMQSQQLNAAAYNSFMMQNQPANVFVPEPQMMMQNQPSNVFVTDPQVMMQNQPQNVTVANPMMMAAQAPAGGAANQQQILYCATLEQMGGVLQPSDNAILIRNFNSQFRPEPLIGLLHTFGTLSSICFVDEECSVVYFSNPGSANTALKAMNGKEIDGKNLEIILFVPQEITQQPKTNDFQDFVNNEKKAANQRLVNQLLGQSVPQAVNAYRNPYSQVPNQGMNTSYGSYVRPKASMIVTTEIQQGKTTQFEVSRGAIKPTKPVESKDNYKREATPKENLSGAANASDNKNENTGSVAANASEVAAEPSQDNASSDDLFAQIDEAIQCLGGCDEESLSDYSEEEMKQFLFEQLAPIVAIADEDRCQEITEQLLSRDVKDIILILNDSRVAYDEINKLIKG